MSRTQINNKMSKGEDTILQHEQNGLTPRKNHNHTLMC